MKLFMLLAFISTTHAFAEGKCSLYELQGKVSEINHDLHLIVAEKTGSEKILSIPIMIQADFSPYVNKFISGSFHLEGPTLKTNQKILKAEKLRLAVYDPLSQNEATASRKIKDIPCAK